jgi:hypothetical protein
VAAVLPALDERRTVYIAGPVYDWLCFILPPLLSIAGVWLASQFEWPRAVVAGPGQHRTRIALFVAVWTYGHLFSVVFRSHFNGEIYRQHRLRFTLVPAAVYLVLAWSNLALVAGLFLIAIWDVYHSSMQNFGLGRIYDAKAGNDPASHRHLDIWMNHVIYIGPILAGASLLPTIEGLRGFQALGFSAPPRAYAWVAAHHREIRDVVVLAGAAYAVYYVDATLRRIQQGYRLPFAKLALLASVAAGSIAAWGFLPPLEAFMVSNLFHSLQYFGIVWWTERSNLARRLHVSDGSGAWPTFAFFASLIVAAGVFYESVGPGSWRWLIPIPMVISLMHFWYDGFVWSVRRGEV